MALDYRDYSMLHRRFFGAFTKGSLHSMKDCHQRLCDVADDLAKKYEKKDSKFTWKLFMEDAGCWGYGPKKVTEARWDTRSMGLKGWPKRWRP